MSERVVIDRGGRIVIPKPLRERLGFEEGDLLLIEEQDGGLVVHAEQTEAGLIERDGLLFKPRDRKAGIIDPQEVNRLIDTMRDPEARNALEREEAKRSKRSAGKSKRKAS